MELRGSASLTKRFVILLLLSMTSGCALTDAQNAAVSQFGASATALGDITSSELIAMREDAIRMNSERLALGGRNRNSKLADETSLDRGFELSRVETVSGATNALAAYGRTLSALVDDTQTAELKKAANDFVGSLGRVPTAKEHISEQQLGALGTVVQDVGGVWINAQRKKAVTTIVLNSRSAVDHLCDLLIRDFDPKSGWVALQLQVLQDPLMGVASSALSDAATYTDRKAAIEAFRLAQMSQTRRREVLSRVVDSAAAMQKANGVLVGAVSELGWSFHDIQDFAQKVRSLNNAVSIVIGK